MRMGKLSFQHPDRLDAGQNRRRVKAGQKHTGSKDQQQIPPQ